MRVSEELEVPVDTVELQVVQGHDGLGGRTDSTGLIPIVFASKEIAQYQLRWWNRFDWMTHGVFDWYVLSLTYLSNPEMVLEAIHRRGFSLFSFWNICFRA